jgi:poly [ADP-ribose] polymerase
MYEEEEETPKAQSADQGEVKPLQESKLDRRVQDFIRLIFDIKQIKSTLAEIGYDSNKMPLGKLSQRTLQQGYEVLKRIEAVLDNKAMGNLESLSSEFFSAIPHDFGFKQVSQFIINTKPKMQAKVAMLEALGDMKITQSILAQESSDLNPIDDHYNKLHCQLFALERSDPVFSLLEMYVQNTHASSHNRYSLEVLNIFAVDRENEAERFRKDLHNHMLLWHGSRLTNWVGILSQGLRIAPPEAPVTGYMFGKGVYFADMVSKSANYCFTSPSNNIGCLLLCDVALGTCNEKLYADHHAEQLPPDTHSTKGCGKNAPPESTYSDLDGVKVPLGKGEATMHNGSLLYNEYIVYDIAQVRMKFLFVVRFNYH